MTTPASPPVNTFQDILNILGQQPQLLQAMRGYILDQELRDLPDTVAELVSAVNGLVEVTRSNTERIDRLEAAVAQLVAVTRSNTERIDRLEAAVAQLAADQAELKATVAQLAADQAELKATVAQLAATVAQLEVTVAQLESAVARLAADQAELKATVARLAATVAQLEVAVAQLEAAVAQLAADQAELKASVAQLVEVSRANTAHLNRVSGLVAQMAGTQYQRFVARIAYRRLRRLLPIPDATVIHTDWNPGAVIEEVTGSDNLSDAEVDDVSVIDFIAAGRDAAGNMTYAAGEISITAQPEDVIKSARRAAAVAKALNATVHPVTIGQVIPDDTRATALEQGVTVIAIAPPD